MLFTALLTLSGAALPEHAVEKGARIFFGHQSVGANVIDGIRDVTAGRLNICEGRSLTSPGLVHAGQHLNPTGRRVVAEALLTFLARLA